MKIITKALVFTLFWVIILFSFLHELSASEIVVLKCTYSYKEVILSTGTLRKTVDFNRTKDNLVLKYHIENIYDLNHVNDYIEIKDSLGYNITYPLKCRKL